MDESKQIKEYREILLRFSIAISQYRGYVRDYLEAENRKVLEGSLTFDEEMKSLRSLLAVQYKNSELYKIEQESLKFVKEYFGNEDDYLDDFSRN